MTRSLAKAMGLDGKVSHATLRRIARAVARFGLDKMLTTPLVITIDDKQYRVEKIECSVSEGGGVL